MKIVYYLPSLHTPGGLERIITFKANYFAENFNDYEITIITSEQSGQPTFFKLSEKVKHIDLNIAFDRPYNQSSVIKALKYPFLYYAFKRRFTRCLMDLRPDITISTLRREVNFINLLTDGSKKIGEFHVTRHSYQAEAYKSNNPIVKWFKKKWAETFLQNISKLDKIILLTHEEAGYWPELQNVTIIPNPIITEMNQVSTCANKQVIAAGRYVRQKGFDLLIASWSIVARKHPTWTLRIYGDGARNELQQIIDKYQLNQNCILEHTVSNIADQYCASSIFVLSSRYEGFGMVITEAMACGVPPVSFACPCGPRDIIKDGEDGLLVENGNIEQLAEKICYLIENEEIRKEMGRKARINVERFKMENIAKQWDELFRKL